MNRRASESPRRAALSSAKRLATLAVAAVAVTATFGTASRLAARQTPPPPVARAQDEGFPIHDETVVRSCGGCHTRDERGRMSRISYMRKTPEGWQTSIRRMASLHNVRVDPAAARQVVRYLANQQGLAPEELAPYRFEVERRMVDFSYTDRETEQVCNACHSMGRVVTERRTKAEWELLVATHRALYPLVDFQRFRSNSPPHPVTKAVDHLATAFPLTTPQWTAWSANVRPPRLEGSWIVTGHDPARGPLHGRATIRAVAGTVDEFETEVAYSYPETGASVRRTGRAIVYTGHQWRGRSSAAGGSDDRREVMSVERGWAEMNGRWYTGAYDEDGVDITLRRAAAGAVVTAVHPRALRTGQSDVELRIFGASLPARLSARDVALGPGISVRSVSRAASDVAVLRVDVAADAPIGTRDVFVGGVTGTDLLAVYDRAHSVRVLPRAGMARVGGEVMPKQLQQFEAVAYHNGADGRAGTEDDLFLGRVPVSWSLEEYPVTPDDDDIRFVGSIDANGLFTPAADGPNPQRSGNRNNIGDVWVVATYSPPDAPPGSPPLRGRAHLLVTVPNYMRWDPWPTNDPARARISDAAPRPREDER